MRHSSIFALFCLLAAAAPLAATSLHSPDPDASPTWPTSFEGLPLSRIPAAPEDARLTRGFPGHIARFSDGHRQIVLRNVGRATRWLHPARECFRATGYVIAPAPMRLAGNKQPSACFRASRNGRALLVCEQVRDAEGQSWPDISSWYWPALFGGSDGPWLAITTIEPVAD
ncbi:hypothetical protein ACFB49_29540 [Sphingomonas sp. DBB INV C78]|uniref:hypothetical protein n=1 Tax=Sphingomonas sp. DBB INV C78 TaxID=3349434 RepID=UPI0036D2C03E